MNKHIEVKYNFVCLHVLNGDVQVQKISIEENLRDMGKNMVSGKKLLQCRNLLSKMVMKGKDLEETIWMHNDGK